MGLNIKLILYLYTYTYIINNVPTLRQKKDVLLNNCM